MNAGNLILNMEKNQLNLTEKKCNIHKVKSKYIVKHLFNYLKKDRAYNIIKYNKNLQDKLEISVKDYQICSEKFTTIKISIKLAQNKYGTFINILNHHESFYHIYFNNSIKETKKYHRDKNERINQIEIIIDYQVNSFKNLFSKCVCIESITFTKFYRKNINDMCMMFYGCSSLKELNLSFFNTFSVVNMSYMFKGCSSLNELNLCRFNTPNLSNMKGMFEDCSLLETVNLTSFNTNKVTDMSDIFCRCFSLKELNIANFNTAIVTDMSWMFFGCSTLKELDLSSFRTDNVKDMNYMFFGCSSLKELNIYNFNIDNKINSENMLYNTPSNIKVKNAYIITKVFK